MFHTKLKKKHVNFMNFLFDSFDMYFTVLMRFTITMQKFVVIAILKTVNYFNGIHLKQTISHKISHKCLIFDEL